mmetsp:Transcript_24782/g.59635  ORF Transcript_24782/g.59635 Transcript_24782/m.59635 type:complete len:97 (+) Transcript_24782:494-784(+)
MLQTIWHKEENQIFFRSTRKTEKIYKKSINRKQKETYKKLRKTCVTINSIWERVQLKTIYATAWIQVLTRMKRHFDDRRFQFSFSTTKPLRWPTPS